MPAPQPDQRAEASDLELTSIPSEPQGLGQGRVVTPQTHPVLQPSSSVSSCLTEPFYFQGWGRFFGKFFNM